MNWDQFIQEERNKPYFLSLYEKVENDRKNGFIVYPEPHNIFNAFRLTPFESVKVIIIGQDPYHGPEQAIGLSFSVPEFIAAPPSLRNVFKEVQDDLGIECLPNGDLSRWARQGVFLLNATLTVRDGQPNSHQYYGWEKFTNRAIKELSEDGRKKVFLLWGANAKKVRPLISNPDHLILTAAHPSPLSAYRGFFGCKHFSKTNSFLVENHQEPIDWR